MGNSSPQIASREHTPFPPDRAGGRVGCPNTRANLRKYLDSCVSDEPQRFSTSLLEEALTPENRSPTVRPALRWTRGWKHSRRETRPPRNTLRPIAPGNGSGSSPPWDLDRSGGLFFCAVGGAASAVVGYGPIMGLWYRLLHPLRPRRSFAGSWSPSSSGDRLSRQDPGLSITTFVVRSSSSPASLASSDSGT